MRSCVGSWRAHKTVAGLMWDTSLFISQTFLKKKWSDAQVYSVTGSGGLGQEKKQKMLRRTKALLLKSQPA